VKILTQGVICLLHCQWHEILRTFRTNNLNHSEFEGCSVVVAESKIICEIDSLEGALPQCEIIIKKHAKLNVLGVHCREA
jgi:hypothetical protein